MPDLALIRRDPQAFSVAIGKPLERWQTEWIHERAREMAILGPRRSGKTRAAVVAALHHCFSAPDRHVLTIAASEETAKRILGEARQVVTRSPLLSASVVDEQTQRLTFSNGSTIRCVAATDAAVRGNRATLVIADEAALISDEVLLGAARPIIASEPEGRIVYISSALRAAGAFYDAVRRGEAGSEFTRTFKWSLGDCDWISASEIEAARESLSELRFRAEYLGEFTSGQDALFSREAVERVMMDYEPLTLATLRPRARLLVGVDYGATTDHSAFAAYGRVPGQRIFGVVIAERRRTGEPLHDFIGEIVSSPGHFHALNSERNGLGEACTQDLFRRFTERSRASGGGVRRHVVLRPQDFDRLRYDEDDDWPKRATSSPPFETMKRAIHTTADLKAATYSDLRLMVDEARVVLPAGATDLRRELLTLRVDYTPSGTEKIEASVGHDDLADALMLAMGPYRTTTGRWRTMLRDAIEAEVPAIPEFEVPGPMVRTPGGTEVPRQPAWQSVFGSGLSLPPGGHFATGEDPRTRRIRERVREAMDRRQWAGAR